MRSRSLAALLATLASIAVPATSRAGEVRVNISNFAFSPVDATLNLGDHMVWIWTGGSHSTTSGDPFGSPSGPVPDGIWDSGVRSLGGEYSWKADRSDMLTYYCVLHWASYMIGSVNIVPSGAGASDFRITEVQYNVAGGQDLIEIANLGTDPGDLGRYRLSVTPGASSAVAPMSVLVPPGGRVTLHANQAGVDSPTQIYLPSLPDLPDVGALTLYVPFSPPGAALDDPGQVVDYVEWGQADAPHEAAAAAAHLWTAGTYVPPVGTGNSMEFCGNTANH